MHEAEGGEAPWVPSQPGARCPPAFRTAKPAHVPGLPQDEKGMDKGKEEEKYTQVGKTWLPFSSSHTRVAKTCSKGKKAKAKPAAAAKDNYYFLNNK